jgi:hypothetical protein
MERPAQGTVAVKEDRLRSMIVVMAGSTVVLGATLVAWHRDPRTGSA